MASPASPIESLPNELLDEIISLLSSAPPSSSRLHQPPSAHITKSRNRDLKNLSLTCSRLLDLVRPHLFSHGFFELNDANDYLSFISGSELGRYVTSVVVKAGDDLDAGESSEPPWWRRLLCSLTPRRLTVIAPPSAIGGMFGMQISQEHSWAFEIPLQIVQLEGDWRNCKPTLSSDEHSSLLDCLPWSSMLFNESSSLKAYNHYEYFLYQIPSIFHRWSAWAYNQSPTERPHLSSSIANLTSLTYVAVFPFYNHVQLVLDAVEFMTSLRYLKIQLGPSQNDRVTEIEQRGSMDPSDCWMELATGYSLIAHAVRHLGRKSCLSKFTASDYEMEAVRAEIDVILGHVLCDGPWTHDGHGTWTKNPLAMSDTEGHSVTPSNMATTYKAEPAEPILAHSLLQQSSEARSEADSASNRTRPDLHPSDKWDLRLDIEKGLHSFPEDVFRPGTVIGFSRLRDGFLDGSDDEFVGELPRHLLTKWLRHTQPQPQPQPPSTTTTPPQTRAFIIHPPNTAIFSPPKLLASLQSHHPPITRNKAISHLDSVHLFPVFDFAAAVQAIHEIADTLSNPSEGQQQQPATTLVIAGLDILTEAVVRASNAVRGTAVLNSALQTLTRLSRVHCSDLSVVLVNTSGVGPTVREDAGAYPNLNPQTLPSGEYERDSTRDEGVQSAFCVMDGPLFPTLLMRTLDQGIDTHLLVSRTRRDLVPVVEVVKDRVGGGVGKWCISDGHRYG
ncbi:hypothetical protein BJX76DRAFT_346837 [Aspergillus varians]